MSRTITRLSSNAMTHYGLAEPFLSLNHSAIMKIAIHAMNAKLFPKRKLCERVLNLRMYVQNTAARVVCQMSKFQHITPVLQELHWLLIQYRIIFKILLLVYKSLSGASPSYLAQLLHYLSPTRSSRSVSNELLMQPRSYAKTYGDRTFAVHAPREWNLIRYEIRMFNTISIFKRALKTFLFSKYNNNRPLFYRFIYIALVHIFF